ncbi:hypothetical protein B0H34DRAFT_674617 [Crassisporium funariophilum]|nr:hypothetical protein B0H34DRAFT_674617 [Crassisporium funariophilum]
MSMSSNGNSPVTRTVAIIKTHALDHRFEIERRIQEASFEIVKERQMEFDTETDPDTLYELFGEDADSFAEGPVWVYVLERRRAVEVWSTLMGPRDPQTAQLEAPNSLRALYGLSYAQNALMGSPDNHTAEVQILSLFASSPPFPTTDLPPEDGSVRYGSMRSVSSGVLAQLRRATTAEFDEGYAASSATNPSTVNGGSNGKLNANGKVLFKARPVPAMDKPDIVPRTTRAAALRAGQAVDKVSNAPRVPVSKERHAQTFANVPGHKRSSTISVASTLAPAIAPRMTRAASLRLGVPPPSPIVRKRALTNEEQTKHGPVSTFQGVPGHKRRESIAVASTAAPSVAPRLNKSAALRQQKEQAPPTSFMFKAPVPPKTPGLSRTISHDSLSPPQQPIPRPASQASAIKPQSQSQSTTPSRYAVNKRASSVASMRPPPSASLQALKLNANGNGAAKPGSGSKSADNSTAESKSRVPPKARPRPSSAMGAPVIVPRTNRSAALRAAKQEAENAAALAAAAKKGPRKGPPSSFKAIAT